MRYTRLFLTRLSFYLGCILIGAVYGVPAAATSIDCPQPRFTGKAPDPIYNQKNPLKFSDEHVMEGQKLYLYKAKPMACKHCHGIKGDGKGTLSGDFHPPPRDFTCAETINGVPDGQLFWIIQNGSPGTAMPSFRDLTDIEIWQLILYLRQLARDRV